MKEQVKRKQIIIKLPVDLHRKFKAYSAINETTMQNLVENMVRTLMSKKG